jgi:hypothetical protein
MEIHKKQIYLIKKAKNFITKKKKDNFNTYDNSFCYFCPHSELPGYALLKYWHSFNKNFFLIVKIITINFLSTFYYKNYKIKKNKNFYLFKYSNIIVTWGNKKCFLKNGSYNDKYFNINSRKEKNILWFIIFQDNNLPEQIDNNCIIFYLENKKFSIKKTFHILKKITLEKIFYYNISALTDYSHSVFKEFKKFLNNNIEKILIPYEGQPFQNTIFKIAKLYYPKIQNIGYVHSFPIGLPTNFIYREGSPDKLIVNGKDQLTNFTKFLGWNKKNIKILQSSRFSRYKIMNGSIFLPYYIKNTNDIFLSLKNLFKKKIYENFNTLVVKNHPEKLYSIPHKKIITKINSILINSKYKKKYSIFFGATSSVIEALERGVKVIHISFDPVFEIYTNKLWPNIKIKKLDDNIFEYSLRKKNQLLKFNKNQTMLKKYLKV